MGESPKHKNKMQTNRTHDMYREGGKKAKRLVYIALGTKDVLTEDVTMPFNTLVFDSRRFPKNTSYDAEYRAFMDASQDVEMFPVRRESFFSVYKELMQLGVTHVIGNMNGNVSMRATLKQKEAIRARYSSGK